MFKVKEHTFIQKANGVGINCNWGNSNVYTNNNILTTTLREIPKKRLTSILSKGFVSTACQAAIRSR